jgi:hypothetical protein
VLAVANDRHDARLAQICGHGHLGHPVERARDDLGFAFKKRIDRLNRRLPLGNGELKPRQRRSTD